MYHHNSLKSASPAQLQRLKELGIDTSTSITSSEADRLIKANYERWSDLPATPKQETLLRKSSLWRSGMTLGEATKLINRLTGNRDWLVGPNGPDSEFGPE